MRSYCFKLILGLFEVIPLITSTAAHAQSSPAGQLKSVVVAGRAYTYDDQADFLYSTNDGTKTYADHQSFRGTGGNDPGNVNGTVLHIAPTGAVTPEWYRVIQASCNGGPILAEASPDGKHWGVQRYQNEATYKNQYIRLMPSDNHRTGYAVAYYLCLWKTGRSFAVAPR